LILPELHAAAWMEMFEPGVKISPAVGLTRVTLGASTFEDVDPVTTVHAAGGVVLVDDGEALALVDEVAVAVAEAVAVAVALGFDVALALVDGVGVAVGVPPPAPLHATPFRVNPVGVSIVPLRLKLPPSPVDAPVAREPFQLRLATVTALPLWVQVPSQPLESVSAPAYEYCRVQAVIAGPSLVMLICTWNPLPQFEVTVYVTAQAGPAASGAAAGATAAAGDAAVDATATDPVARVPATSALQPAHTAMRRHGPLRFGRNVRMGGSPPCASVRLRAI
jgi:hypothetical protein